MRKRENIHPTVNRGRMVYRSVCFMSTDQIGFTEFADSDPFTLLTVRRSAPSPLPRSHDHYTPKRVSHP